MRVWLEIDVQRAAAGLLSGLFEGEHFRVLHAIVGVNTGAHDAASCVHNHCADVGIGRGQSQALARQLERASQKLIVSGVVGHGRQDLPQSHRDTEKNK